MARPLAFTKAKIEKNTLTFDVTLQEPRPSKAGKTLLVASDNGGTGQLVAGQEVVLNVNSYVYPEPRDNPAKPLARAKAVQKGRVLTVTVPLTEPRPSSSGKTMLVASDSGGTGIKLAGKEIIVGFSAYFYPAVK
jgi:hypothetical protein